MKPKSVAQPYKELYCGFWGYKIKNLSSGIELVEG